MGYRKESGRDRGLDGRRRRPRSTRRNCEERRDCHDRSDRRSHRDHLDRPPLVRDLWSPPIQAMGDHHGPLFVSPRLHVQAHEGRGHDRVQLPQYCQLLRRPPYVTRSVWARRDAIKYDRITLCWVLCAPKLVALAVTMPGRAKIRIRKQSIYSFIYSLTIVSDFDLL